VASNGSSPCGHPVLPAPDQVVRVTTVSFPNTRLTYTYLHSATAAVSNQWIGLKTGSTSYALSSTQAGGTKFFIRKYDPTGTYAFYNADDTRQVALLGPNGILLSLVDFTNPNTGSIPSGQLMEWATFTNDNNVLFVKDGSTLTNRTFVAVKGSGSDYTVALYDGE
jgi:hypothetical protein